MSKEQSRSDQPVGMVWDVHRNVRIGMPESAYGAGFAGELAEDGFEFEQKARMPVCGKRQKVKPNYCIDLLIDGKMIVELKGISGDAV